MKSLTIALLPVLLALSVCQSTCAAPANTQASASFQATFVVQEACTITSPAGGTSNPGVRCQHNSPYLIERHTASDGRISVTF